MSNALTAAAEVFEREATRSAGLLAASAELKRIGSLQQAADEAQARVDALKAEQVTLTAQIEADRQAASTAKATAMAEIDASKGAAEAHVGNQTQEAQQIIANAEAQAKQLIRTAQAQVDKMLDDANTRIASTQTALGNLTQAVKDKAAEVAKMDADIVERRATLDAIRKLKATL